MNNLGQTLKRNWLWLLYLIFLLSAFFTHEGESPFLGDGPYSYGKIVLWVVWLVFLWYSLKISLKENFFKSLVKLNPILWSRQIGLDLYIGLLIPLFIIYLHEGSVLVTLIWFVPIFLFANLATLVYLALNYGALIERFIS